MTEEPEARPSSDPQEPGATGADPSAGRAPLAEGGLAGIAGTAGTSGIFTSGIGEPAGEDEETTALDQVVDSAADTGWGRDRDVAPGESLPKD
ncbi:MAG: hypothetical protein ABR511_06040 [Acidimicrobiales bacterium]